MVKAVVLYGVPEDPDAFERYYADTHTALANAIPGLQRFEAARAVATPDGSELPASVQERAGRRGVDD